MAMGTVGATAWALMLTIVANDGTSQVVEIKGYSSKKECGLAGYRLAPLLIQISPQINKTSGKCVDQGETKSTPSGE